MKHIDFRNMTTSMRMDNGRIIAEKLPYAPLPENYDLYELNDFHDGNAAMSEKMVKKAVAAIAAQKHSYVILQGDHLETVAITDSRYSISVHGNRLTRFNAQRNDFMRLLEPIADKVLWLLDGNHEAKIHNIYQPNDDIAANWNTVYADSTFVKALFDNWRLGSWHGAGVINSRAGDELQRRTNQLIGLKRNLRNLPVDDCDIVTCGHYHQCLYHPPTEKLVLISKSLELQGAYSKPGKIWVDKAKGLYRIHDDDRHWMCCGSFLRAYAEGISSYTENAGYQATELGYGHIRVRKGVPTVVEVVKME